MDYLLVQFGVYSKLEQKVQRVPSPSPRAQSPLLSTSVTVREPRQHNHPKSTVYIRVHWVYVLWGLTDA